MTAAAMAVVTTSAQHPEARPAVQSHKGTSEKVVDLNLGARIRHFSVENLRNSSLLRAIFASNRQILTTNLFGPDFLRFPEARSSPGPAVSRTAAWV